MKIKKLNVEYNIEDNINYDEPDVSYASKHNIFFDDKDLQSKDELIKLKNNFVNKLNDKGLNDIQIKYYMKTLYMIYLYIDYINYFEKRYGKKTYRLIGELKDKNMDYEKMRIKASLMKSVINYSYDGGFVDYWAFNDIIVIKTIRNIKKDKYEGYL